MGWIVAIIVGAIAGWIAEKIMKADHGLLTNIVLGIIGAMIFNGLLSLVGIAERTGFFGSLIAGVIGACLLIWIWRMIKGRS
ncbi:GlsB/YeaQ/YmgE family stress response membrane protein [Pontivivens nitratireducens]|uniref:GlsB/YeaQ/YmgE family stress response membrane protein n=1 Tax=Pontivivens nitratireducens TaxID=2758038 RepID=A0A6G7VN82_9RHOB|nr:GlsB/YeaQ/YmgE family stress response membrane protein [Pontibrevibacter nitratireducens]QIK41308.1 GlsB/YeaQ/YmgE family stress response membrane protein [Pontibrevibacter nitratireducens]